MKSSTEGYSIKICKEVSEFLGLQIYGKCSSDCNLKLTKVNLTEKTKELFKPIWNFLYFGDEKLSFTVEQLTEIYQTLSKLRANVSKKEVKLIDYMALCISNSLALKNFEELYKVDMQ